MTYFPAGWSKQNATPGRCGRSQASRKGPHSPGYVELFLEGTPNGISPFYGDLMGFHGDLIGVYRVFW